MSTYGKDLRADLKRNRELWSLHGSLDLTESQSEKQLWLLLGDDFDIDYQVTGDHFSGKRFRVDAVITPKDQSDWKDDRTAFAIEVKGQSTSKKSRDYTRHLGQCADYANTVWRGYQELGPIPVISFPRFIPHHKLDLETHFQMQRIAGRLGVGEFILHYKHGWSIELQGHVIWSSLHGVTREGRTWSMRRKYGSSR
jgi:hypothetical protein